MNTSHWVAKISLFNPTNKETDNVLDFNFLKYAQMSLCLYHKYVLSILIFWMEVSKDLGRGYNNKRI